MAILALHLLLLLLLAPLCSLDSPFSASLASRFSLRTAYRNVFRQRLALPPGCRPLAVSAVLRSGTAVPDRATIDRIAPLLLRLRFGSAPATQALLTGWKSSFYPEDSDRLTSEGKREADHIGARLQRLLAHLQLNATSSEFAAEAGAGAARLKGAAEAFARNFGAEGVALRLQTLPQEDLPLYAPCRGAPTARATVGGLAEEEVRAFRRGHELRYRLKKFNERHRPETKFSLDDFLTAFDVCAYDTAVDDDARTSPWCELFTREDIYAIEYLQDLEQFWRGSYGRATNVLPACGIASKMMKMLATADKSSIKGQFLFTEAGTFLSLLSLLRIVRTGGALRSADFPFAASRHFRSSRLVPFSANLVLVLLRCAEEPEPVLLPFLNENRRSWANCSSPCALQIIGTYLSPCAPRGDALCLQSRNEAPGPRAMARQLLGAAAVVLVALLRP